MAVETDGIKCPSMSMDEYKKLKEEGQDILKEAIEKCNEKYSDLGPPN